MEDAEFKAVMCQHMQKQTEFLGTISRVATIYEKKWDVARGVVRVFKWGVGVVASGYALWEVLKGR